MPGEKRQRGAYSVSDDRKGGGGWWKWLLPLLLLLALILLLVFLLGGDDDENGSAGGTDTAAQTAPEAGGERDSAGPAGGGEGTLTAGDASLLPVPGDLARYVGDDAEGKGVEVLSVVATQGFWVGTSDEDRVYVEYGGDVGEDERDVRPEVGDRVNLTGPLRPAPADPGRTLRLEKADSDQVERQGAFINASTVEKAG